MSPEVIIVAIGCYLFCGISEKIYRIETGDWRTGGMDTDFQKELSEFVFVPNETSYEQVIEKFGNRYFLQRTHRVIRRQEYNARNYYFNREVLYIYRKRYNFQTQMFNMYKASYLQVYLFFKDNVLQFYDIYDERVDEKTGRGYYGRLHNSLLKEKAVIEGCHELFYDIFTLYKVNSWGLPSSNCDFYKDKTYWDDPVYDWRKYFYEKGGLPCGGTIFNSC